MSRLKLTELAHIAEIVAAVAVVVSLIYVGKEVQSNTSAVRGAAMQAIATTDADALMMIASDAELSEITRIGRQDPSQLSQADAYRYELWMRQFWLSFQNIFMQSELGLIDSSVWRSYLTVICGMWSEPGTRESWPDHVDVLNSDFAAVIDQCQLASVSPAQVNGQSFEDRVVANHYAYVPSGAGPFHTLVAIPGCSGISTEDSQFENSNPDLQEDDLLFRRHYRKMAASLRDHGFAVYLIDVHRSEGVLTACGGEIQIRDLAEYISAAIVWVADQPQVDKNRIHLIGWSMGARGVLEWLHRPSDSTSILNSAIAVYPGCGQASELTVQMPLLLILGGADDVAEPAECENLVREAAVKDQIILKVYSDARHGFDIEDAPPMIEIGGGMTVGYQRAAAEESWKEILFFLRRGD